MVLFSKHSSKLMMRWLLGLGFLVVLMVWSQWAVAQGAALSQETVAQGSALSQRAALRDGKTLLTYTLNAQSAEHIRLGVRAFVVGGLASEALNVNAFVAMSAFLDSTENEVLALILDDRISVDSLAHVIDITGLNQFMLSSSKMLLNSNYNRLLVFGSTVRESTVPQAEGNAMPVAEGKVIAEATNLMGIASKSVDSLKLIVADYELVRSINKAIACNYSTLFLYSPLKGALGLIDESVMSDNRAPSDVRVLTDNQAQSDVRVLTDARALTDNQVLSHLNLLSAQDSVAQHRTFYPWVKMGRKPDFVWAEPQHLPMLGALVDSMNGLQAYSGVITYNNQLLNEIRWIDRAGVVSNGIFSFPKNAARNYELYTPWKEGYSFYPEVVKFDPNNTHQEFSAIKLSLKDDLLFYFNFEKGVRNEVDKSVYENELFSVNFEKDKGRGKVLCLERKGAAVQFKKSPEFDTSKPFTIATWIKPDSISGIHTIVSKGLVFSFKIRHGGLSFSGTGFPSVILDSLVLTRGSWQHLACVYVPDYHVQFFLNGQLIHDEAFGNVKVIEQALTIGNNFSSESFSGQLDDLMIWNRALSNEEIAVVYSRRYRFSTFSSTSDWVFLLGGLLLVLIYGVLRRKKKAGQGMANDRSEADNSGKQGMAHDRSEAEGNEKGNQGRNDELAHQRIDAHLIEKGSQPDLRICLFGELFIPGEKGENLARQLTPRLRQLFVLLAIHPQGVTIGQLNTDIWPGYDEAKAKQNRNYAIQQLKKTLSNNPAIRLEYRSKNWVLELDSPVEVDVILLQKMEEDLLHHRSKDLFGLYLSIIERGKFLPGIDNECFDAIKATVAENINAFVATWTAPIAEGGPAKDSKATGAGEWPAKTQASPKTCLRLGSILLVQDSLSEEGLRISIRALIDSGRNGEALEMYQTYAKRYKNTYNQVFSTPFQSFI
jgi:hypothetical protein